jgi:hypothetical protein
VGYYVVDVDGASFSWGKVFYLGSGEGVAGKDVDDALDVLFKTCNGRFELIYLSRVVTRFCVNRGRGRRETVILFLELAVSCGSGSGIVPCRGRRTPGGCRRDNGVLPRE